MTQMTPAPDRTIDPLQPLPLVGQARFAPGEIVRHRLFGFRGVIFDIDPVFANSDEWYEAIPESMRPAKDQPFYHLLAENDDSSYIAYVSQQNLVADGDAGPVDHPQIAEMFDGLEGGRYQMRRRLKH
jgi:heat shock protein HspQ